jgi:hypothetical protein
MWISCACNEKSCGCSDKIYEDQLFGFLRDAFLAPHFRVVFSSLANVMLWCFGALVFIGLLHSHCIAIKTTWCNACSGATYVSSVWCQKSIYIYMYVYIGIYLKAWAWQSHWFLYTFSWMFTALKTSKGTTPKRNPGFQCEIPYPTKNKHWANM